MIKWLVIIIAIVQFGCSKEIEINLVNKKRLVLNSIFDPDEIFKFRISITSSLLDNYQPFNENIDLSLYEGDRLVFDSILQSGILDTNLRPKPGIKYTVELKSNKFQPIKAIDTIPTMVAIDNAFMIFPAGVDAFGFYKAEVNISFTDPPNETNYYEILISSKQGGTNGWYSGYETNDPVLMEEGDQDYHPITFFFSDKLFNGKSYTMKIKNTIGYQLQNDILIPNNLFVTLRSVSRTYYTYRKYYTRHSYNQQFQNEFVDLIFKGEPQDMFTNVENGFGIFAGYCETTSQITQNE